MNRLVSDRKIVPTIDKVFAFDDARDAYKHLESQKHVGKVVIRLVEDASVSVSTPIATDNMPARNFDHLLATP